MNELQVFNNGEFGQVRTIEENGKVLFCGSDVAKALGYVKPHNAISTHCKDATLKQGIPHPQSGGKTIEMLFIPEGDVYRLIINSKLPSAEKFERWVYVCVVTLINKKKADKIKVFYIHTLPNLGLNIPILYLPEYFRCKSTKDTSKFESSECLLLSAI